MPTLHYIEWDAPKAGPRKQLALCGAYVHPREHSQTPTCPKCQTLLPELLAAFAEEDK